MTFSSRPLPPIREHENGKLDEPKAPMLRFRNIIRKRHIIDEQFCSRALQAKTIQRPSTAAAQRSPAGDHGLVERNHTPGRIPFQEHPVMRLQCCDLPGL
jgi:hypothetical protein